MIIQNYKEVKRIIDKKQYLKYAIITGCLKIAKESIFTGTNNQLSYTITYTP